MPESNTIPVTVTHQNGGYVFKTYFNLNYIRLQGIRANLESLICEIGQPVDYGGVIITAVYEDESTENITNLCSFVPVAGTILAEDTVAEVTYQEKSCSFLLVLGSELLEITLPPNKMDYIAGETLDYTGIQVSASYDDGTFHDVTACCSFEPPSGAAFSSPRVLVSCAKALDSYVYDLNTGYIGINNKWIPENPTDTYADIYQVQAGHSYLLALGAVVGSRFRAIFTTVDVSQTTATVTGEPIIIADDPSPMASATYTPGANGYIVVAKDNVGVSGLKSFLYDADSTEKSERVYLTLIEITLVSLTITSVPAKTEYLAGETINYAGLVVIAAYSDGSTANVTSRCSITPSEGKAFDPSTDTTVDVAFGGLSTTLTLTELTLVGLTITSAPAKTEYFAGDTISYAGLVVTATYSNGTTANVTSQCSITPAEGKAFDPSTDTTVNITLGGLSTTLTLTEITLIRIVVSIAPAKTMYVIGEAISYAGLLVTAIYSNSTTADVTSQCVITPAEGKSFNPNTDTHVSITFGGCSASLTLSENTLDRLEIADNPSQMAYKPGEIISYEGLTVNAVYANGYRVDVTGSCSITPQSGKAFDYRTDTNVVIMYFGISASLTLTAVQSILQITTPPSKTSYVAGESISYAGMVVKAVYSDGTQHTVTAYCDFEPAQGTAYTEDITRLLIKCAPPLETYVYDQNLGYIDNGVWKYENPTRTYIDIYPVLAGHTYLLTLGAVVGSRFRAMFTTVDLSKASSNVTGTRIVNTNNPAVYANATYTPSTDGYIAVAKDNVGVSGLISYLYDTTAASSDKTEIIQFNL